jgi:hypothetical protein
LPLEGGAGGDGPDAAAADAGDALADAFDAPDTYQVPCNYACTSAGFGTLLFACPAVVVSADITGPCASANDASALAGQTTSDVIVATSGPGICHVTLTFEGGFTYSTDFDFTWQTEPEPPGCPPCPPHLGPTQGPFMVDNPSSTCIDDGGVEGGDGDDGGGDGW